MKCTTWMMLAASLTARCVTIPSDVVPVDKDTYQLNMTGVGFATQGNTNIKALKAANDYCTQLGKRMLAQHSAENGVYGWSPRQDTLVLKCLDANDPEYTAGKIEPEAAKN